MNNNVYPHPFFFFNQPAIVLRKNFVTKNSIGNTKFAKFDAFVKYKVISLLQLTIGILEDYA